ncbi:MAG: hypothetical protein ACKOEO_08095 [Planctomycetaceae bacterium]
MPTSLDQLHSFQAYAAARLQTGGAQLELDDLLDEWKSQHTEYQTGHDDALAVSASLRDIERGARGALVEDVIADLKTRYHVAEAK